MNPPIETSSAIIVIPARYASGRFPGKPLALIAGKSLLERVWQVAKAVPEAHRVIIATDDSRIETHAKSFGAEVVMTSADCRDGSERCLQAIEALKLNPEVLVNLQGDTPLTPPWVLSELISAMADKANKMATPAVQLTKQEFEALLASKKAGEVGGTTVTFDKSGKALYFTKGMIPFLRTTPSGSLPIYRHIGIYAYRPAVLADLMKYSPGPLELCEQLEQLRALENGVPIKVVVVDYRGRSSWSVDNPSDVARVEAIIAREGELVA